MFQAQTLAGLLRRLRWWVTDADRSSRTDSCLLGRTGASQAPLLSLRIRVEDDRGADGGRLCRRPRTGRGR